VSRTNQRGVRIGCSGWSYQHWREDLYSGEPPSKWLRLYAARFRTVEINSTFYRLASKKGVAAWVEQTPADFVFAVKASRYLTHVKRLQIMKAGVARFYEPLEELIASGKLGPTLWQFPENLHRDDELLASALKKLPRRRHCFEFRHPSWFCRETYDLLRKHRVALVIGDHPERPFQTRELTADWTYIRFHYGSRGRDGNYSKSELQTWARRIASWRSRAEVFAYFNNDWRGSAHRNARTLSSLLSSSR
jgi:uncharacterized protein YecE (DUF72 family)